MKTEKEKEKIPAFKAEQKTEKKAGEKTGWKRMGIPAVFVILALAAAGILVYPEYHAFVEADYAETCYDARYYTCVRYQQAIRQKLQDGEAADELDYEQILRDVIAANYSFTLNADLISEDLCRGGGTCTFVIDEATHRLSITCDQPSHLPADDAEVDDDVMDYVSW